MLVDRLEQLSQRFNELDRLLADPAVVSDQDKLRQYGKEYHELATVMAHYKAFKEVLANIDSTKELVQDPGIEDELLELAEIELEELQANQASLEEELQKLLIPKDPEDSKDVICEIRAGTGGDEAAIFAGELYRMYYRFSEMHKWRTEVMNSNPTEMGGFKEVIFAVSGQDVFGTLKHESGVHRVQRVPVTETQGRVHTSAASVVVLPEAEDVDIAIDPNDLKIDVYRSSGPGGQSVNTTDSAVRITHLPTALVVTCQDEKSQHKNKAKALKVLRARLFDIAKQAQEEKMSSARRSQVRSGDRSEKIRTYNFPQGRVTDHRIGLSLYKLDRFMEGEIDEIVRGLAEADHAEKMNNLVDEDAAG